MTTNSHPAHGPLSNGRLHRIREILGKAAAQSDGGNIGYAMSDAVKAIDELLAGRKAEPVAFIGERMLEDVTDGARSCGRIWSDGTDEISGERRIPLYTAPPAPVSVPDFGALTKCIVQRLVDYGAADDDAIASAEEFVYNACRDAMLHGAEPVTTAYKLPVGWVAVPVEPTEAMLNAWLSEVANWRGHVAGYKAMLAAAPQYEVNPAQKK
ncbi:hypothetical protein [Citrobacter koseri]|uniref:hypothetical protein n=1 Tax=Citrobacter koseri TaxID=545 RepID=UPI001E58E7C2|nr:hypothetical protein [Citrobacter koseri]